MVFANMNVSPQSVPPLKRQANGLNNNNTTSVNNNNNVSQAFAESQLLVVSTAP